MVGALLDHSYLDGRTLGAGYAGCISRFCAAFAGESLVFKQTSPNHLLALTMAKIFVYYFVDKRVYHKIDCSSRLQILSPSNYLYPIGSGDSTQENGFERKATRSCARDLL
jgi:hypothetical protein